MRDAREEGTCVRIMTILCDKEKGRVITILTDIPHTHINTVREGGKDRQTE